MYKLMAASDIMALTVIKAIEPENIISKQYLKISHNSGTPMR